MKIHYYILIIFIVLLCLNDLIAQTTVAEPIDNSNVEGIKNSPKQNIPRSFYSPTGHGIKKGEAYYTNLFLYLSQIDYGINDKFSIGLGISPLLIIGSPSPIWLTPKISIPTTKERLNISMSLLTGVFVNLNRKREKQIATFGMAFTSATLGDRSRNLSIGLGYGFLKNELAKKPAISISGMCKINERGYFVTENYILPGLSNFPVLSLGGRHFWNKASIDYGLFIVEADVIWGYLESRVIGVPWLSVNVPLSKRN